MPSTCYCVTRRNPGADAGTIDPDPDALDYRYPTRDRHRVDPRRPHGRQQHYPARRLSPAGVVAKVQMETAHRAGKVRDDCIPPINLPLDNCPLPNHRTAGWITMPETEGPGTVDWPIPSRESSGQMHLDISHSYRRTSEAVRQCPQRPCSTSDRRVPVADRSAAGR